MKINLLAVIFLLLIIALSFATNLLIAIIVGALFVTYDYMLVNVRKRDYDHLDNKYGKVKF